MMNKKQDINLFYCGEKVGYVSFTYITKHVHYVHDDDDHRQEPVLHWKEDSFDTIEYTDDYCNNNDPETPAYQGINTIHVYIKDGLIYAAFYGEDLKNRAELANASDITPKSRLGFSLSEVYNLIIQDSRRYVDTIIQIMDKEDARNNIEEKKKLR